MTSPENHDESGTNDEMGSAHNEYVRLGEPRTTAEIAQAAGSEQLAEQSNLVPKPQPPGRERIEKLVEALDEAEREEPDSKGPPPAGVQLPRNIDL